MRAGKVLSKCDDQPLSDPATNRKLRGSLKYMTLTRLNISYGANKFCQFMATPSDIHWLVAKYMRSKTIAGAFVCSIACQANGYGEVLAYKSSYMFLVVVSYICNQWLLYMWQLSIINFV